MFFNQAGQPMEALAWAEAFSDYDGRRVGLHVFSDGLMVSTLWFGIDLTHGLSEQPMIFESMVFVGPADNQQRTYASHSDAVAGHELLVAGLFSTSGTGHDTRSLVLWTSTQVGC